MLTSTLTDLTDRIPTAVPLLPVPERIPAPLLLVTTAVVLAALDLLGALAAKAWADHRSIVWFGTGIVLFGLLFWVYGSALQYAELAAVTIAWIVVLQVGLVLVDRFRHGVGVPADKWVAIGAILVFETYLLLAPTSTGSAQ